MAGSIPASRTGREAADALAGAPVFAWRPSSSLRAEAWRRFRRHRLALFGGAVLMVMVIAVLAGPFV